MTARYNSSDNTLKEISQMEKPDAHPSEYDFESALYIHCCDKWREYNDHIDTLRTLSCHPSAKTVWKEGDVLTEYVHYVVRDESTVTNNEDGTQTKNAPAYVAFPLVPVKSEDAEVKDYIDTMLSAYIDQQGRELAVECIVSVLKEKFVITRKQ